MNSKGHLRLSIAKSFIRMISILVAMWYRNWMLMAEGFLIAEVLGVFEEVYDDR